MSGLNGFIASTSPDVRPPRGVVFLRKAGRRTCDRRLYGGTILAQYSCCTCTFTCIRNVGGDRVVSVRVVKMSSPRRAHKKSCPRCQRPRTIVTQKTSGGGYIHNHSEVVSIILPRKSTSAVRRFLPREVVRKPHYTLSFRLERDSVVLLSTRSPQAASSLFRLRPAKIRGQHLFYNLEPKAPLKPILTISRCSLLFFFQDSSHTTTMSKFMRAIGTSHARWLADPPHR
jgi:hypothetical protein